jgi:hypothetical protein
MDAYAHSTIRLHGVVLQTEAQFKVHNTARFEALTAVLSDCLALEKKDPAVIRKVGHYTPKDTASHPRRHESSSVSNTVKLNEISKVLYSRTCKTGTKMYRISFRKGRNE